MADPIRILICEDNPDDAVLVVAHLRRGGVELEYERVDEAEAAREALRERPPDLVISDYWMPGFGAEDALDLVKASGLDIPFILVSGRIGEESATALMRAGAHDFVLKDQPARLVRVVRRELRQTEVRRERRAAEVAVRLSEQRFRLFADHTPDVMFRYRVHPTEEVEYVSPAASAVLGRAPQELCGDPATLFALVAPEDRDALAAAWHSSDPRPLVVRWPRADGADTWTEQRAVALHDQDGRVTAVEGILRDITDRVIADRQRDAMQQQLRQAERLESMGRLAGGIAHDFNNLLAVILGHTDLALTDLPPDSPHRPGMAAIHTLAERGAALTRQLLVFSRQEPLRPETLDANEVVADTERVLRGTIGEDVTFVTRLAPDLRPIRIDRSELERLLLNLVTNARRAMPSGGRLEIETANVRRAGAADGGQNPDPDQSPDGVGPASIVRLSVSDTGSGMPERVRKHVFEPYFTTDAEAGTGLGLSSAYGVVKAAGGEIAISSRPGEGTVVRIDLPAVERPTVAPASPEPAPAQGRGQTLLVVEDDDAVRDLVCRMAGRGGYRTVGIAAPSEALRVYRESAGSVDALLTDLVMSGMSGIELATAVREQDPALPVLLMSGYSAGTLPGDRPLPDGMALLHKPFTTAALLTALGEVLGGGTREAADGPGTD
ncbi:response regulator [Actinospica durhamensis]|uniref:histidine kinase n=1 Tax=Actinospica durhamensis TaxID=1508375 RepID=A0A941EZ86_9ACTN|nr:response regulator [Actinospica durhamensis]MBR7836839.1 response regulator [Actinospica durhamensis]